ncbi:MAG: hypothetical protein PHZ19_01790 [Candidatus Thermoplasmatota archaeon]|nr:hypothetical protein [Candidatus Thermoplasmatota archaeon]
MMDHTTFTTRTDRLVEIIEADAALQQLFGQRVYIGKGLRRLDMEQYSVWVHRVRVDDYGYWMGRPGTDLNATWAVTCIARRFGDPEGLEEDLSRLVAHVASVLLQCKQDALWTVMQLQGSEAVMMRDEADGTQYYEIEPILVRLEWEEQED